MIQKQITEVLTAHGILEEAVDMAATIDLKANEPGLLSLTEKKDGNSGPFQQKN